MDNKLLIFKIGLNFWHRRNNNPLSDRNISDFEVSIDNNFVIVELDGSQNWVYKVENVSILVDTIGTTEIFANRLLLIARLQEIGYTPYLVVNGLTLNELNAIRNSNNPSQSNPFATMQDIGSGSTSTPPAFGTFVWEKRGTNHSGQTPISGDIFSGMISATEGSNEMIWNGTGALNNTNLANFNILSTFNI